MGNRNVVAIPVGTLETELSDSLGDLLGNDLRECRDALYDFSHDTRGTPSGHSRTKTRSNSDLSAFTLEIPVVAA